MLQEYGMQKNTCSKLDVNGRIKSIPYKWRQGREELIYSYKNKYVRMRKTEIVSLALRIVNRVICSENRTID
jgi:hypothetical protein